MTESTASKVSARKFYKGEFVAYDHEDWRQLIRVCATRRRSTPHLLGTDAGKSHAVGEFVRLVSKSVHVGPMLEVLRFHQFLPMIADPVYGSRYEICGNADLRAALQSMHKARGLSADAFRKASGNSSSMTTFINGRAEGRSDTVSSSALTRLLQHYGTPLVVRDLLDRSVLHGSGPAD